jgi:hypothetical protein
MRVLGNDLTHKMLSGMLARLARQYRIAGLDEAQIKTRCRAELAAFMGCSTWNDLLGKLPSKPSKSFKFKHTQAIFNHKTIVSLIKLGLRCNANAIRISHKDGIQINQKGSGSSWHDIESRGISDQDVSSLIKHLSGHEVSLLGRGTYWFMHDEITEDGKALRGKMEVNGNSAPVVSLYLLEPSNRRQDIVNTIPSETIFHQQGVVIVSHAYRLEETIEAICRRRQQEMTYSADKLVHIPEGEVVSWPKAPSSLIRPSTLRVFSLYEGGDLNRTLALPPHVLVLKPWAEGDQLANAMEAQRGGCPVYLGVSGDDFRFTHKIERVVDAVLNIFECLPERSWQSKAQELVKNLHSVVAVCNTHNHFQSIETLILTPVLRAELIAHIAGAEKPGDLYSVLAKMVVACGTSISSNVMLQEEMGIITKGDRDWLLTVDEEWHQQWA